MIATFPRLPFSTIGRENDQTCVRVCALLAEWLTGKLSLLGSLFRFILDCNYYLTFFPTLIIVTPLSTYHLPLQTLINHVLNQPIHIACTYICLHSTCVNRPANKQICARTHAMFAHFSLNQRYYEIPKGKQRLIDLG